MSIDTALTTLLAPIFDGEFFPDTATDPEIPYATYQQVGGGTVEFVSADLPSKRNARVQFNVWAMTRIEARTKVDALRAALLGSATLQASAIGEAVATHEPETDMRGFQQDFSLWYDA